MPESTHDRRENVLPAFGNEGQHQMPGSVTQEAAHQHPVPANRPAPVSHEQTKEERRDCIAGEEQSDPFDFLRCGKPCEKRLRRGDSHAHCHCGQDDGAGPEADHQSQRHGRRGLRLAMLAMCENQDDAEIEHTQQSRTTEQDEELRSWVGDDI